MVCVVGAGAEGPAAGHARPGGESAQGVEVDPVAHVGFVRAGNPLQAHGHIDNARVDLAYVLPAQVPLLHLAHAEVVDDDVALFDQSHGDIPAVGMAHVQGDAFLVGVAVGEIPATLQSLADAVLEGAALAQDVRALLALDLDDFCAELAEDVCGDGAGADPGEVTHHDAVQCSFQISQHG